MAAEALTNGLAQFTGRPALGSEFDGELLRTREADAAGEPLDVYIHVLASACERGGNVRLRYLRQQAVPIAFRFIDEFGNSHPASQVEQRVFDAGQVNLARARDLAPAWQTEALAPGAGAGQDLNADWTLQGQATPFLSSGHANGEHDGQGPIDIVATARLLDPSGDGPIDLAPGEQYLVSVLAAAHRCVARIRCEAVSPDGAVLSSQAQWVDAGAMGGSREGGYHRVEFAITAPEQRSTLSLVAEKGVTDFGQDSFLFLAAPIVRAGADGALEEITLPLALLRSAAGPGEIVELLLAPPAELISTGQARLVLRAGAPTGVLDLPVELVVRPDVILDHAYAKAGVVRFQGRVCAEQEALGISLFVDGAASSHAHVPVTDGRFESAIAVSPDHLDGLPHALELRTTTGHLLLAAFNDLLPVHVTPWPVLQKYARMPLDIGQSPATAHHFRAMKRWLQRVARSEPLPCPAPDVLHDILQAGVRKRRAYPRLTFPEVPEPEVSVIIPVHSKWEITFFCLASLLFAGEATPFEVIVVDDGSDDETLDIARMASGVRVVRHEAAQGFVAACNDGAAIARGRYLAFLNNDTEVTAGWLDELVETMTGFDEVGLVGSKLVYPDGQLQEAGGIVWRSGNPWNVGRGGNPADPRFNYLRQADYLSGASIMIERELFEELGGFSPEMAPAYFEDTDLAMKVRTSGRRVVYVPTSLVFHYEGQSAGTDVTTGLKRFQEVNRPKFKRRWAELYGRNGVEGVRPDLEKDRNAAFRVLFVDLQFPQVDSDAGSYAAFQEIRLIQSLGGKVTLLPRNLAWLDRHTLAMERIGVECLYAPYVQEFGQYLIDHACDYDLVYVCRYALAREVIPLVRAHSKAKVVFNLADLHFLRELREAAAGSPGYSLEAAAETRAAELEAVSAADLTLSYSDIEIAILESHVGSCDRIARLPWVLDIQPQRPDAFDTADGLLYLGNFGHPPNRQAVTGFAREVLPRIRAVEPSIRLKIVGNQMTPEVAALQSDAVDVLGHVADLSQAFSGSRVFVAPLLAGAGIKGKVLEAISRGLPCVLTPTAAEGTGLVDGVSCLIARTQADWVDAVVRLHSDRSLWEKIAAGGREVAINRYSFESGSRMMEDALASLGIYAARSQALVYRHARPLRYGR